MALKVGTENKRNVIIAVALFCVLAYLVIHQLFGGSDTPAPVNPPRQTARTTVGASGANLPSSLGSTSVRTPSASGNIPNGTAPRKLEIGSALDPALHLDKLAMSESIEYAGSGRNIFSADSRPVEVEAPVAPARPQDVQQADLTPQVPQPPAIDLHYFGFSSNKEGKRHAFFVHGDDIFEASAGDIVNHRYKVVEVDPHSVRVTDMNYNNTQTLQLSSN